MTIKDAIRRGYPIYIATKEIQVRKHHKKRINKKWQKRYGYFEINMMPHNDIVMTDDGVLYMTKKTYQRLKKIVEKESKE